MYLITSTSQSYRFRVIHVLGVRQAAASLKSPAGSAWPR